MSTGHLKDDLIKIEICQMFGWTSQQYEEQPLNFIQLIIEKIKVDRIKSNASAANAPSN